jgi:hypothetical protein
MAGGMRGMPSSGAKAALASKTRQPQAWGDVIIACMLRENINVVQHIMATAWRNGGMTLWRRRQLSKRSQAYAFSETRWALAADHRHQSSGFGYRNVKRRNIERRQRMSASLMVSYRRAGIAWHVLKLRQKRGGARKAAASRLYHGIEGNRGGGVGIGGV